MQEFKRLRTIVEKLRSREGCPWDRAQTHDSLKAPCIEEAAEVVCGINILSKTGDPRNLQEELGDLLLQVMMHAQIASEEGLFDIDDVMKGISEKMIRRHPHVFGEQPKMSEEEVPGMWEEIKKKEKAGKTDDTAFLPQAFDEAISLIERARERKGFTDGEIE
ncbi:MAG: hypothetical protein IJI24_06835 [Lachnospiraceae bacterium]|nr:hypothetical protein [Lachnospiraceae bacterium]